MSGLWPPPDPRSITRTAPGRGKFPGRREEPWDRGGPGASAEYAMTTDIPASITTPDGVERRLGSLTSFDGLPDEMTVQKIYDNLDFQRGGQAFLGAVGRPHLGTA